MKFVKLGLAIVKQRLLTIWALAKGTRYDRMAGRIAGLIGFVAFLLPFAHVIPGPTGQVIAGICAVAATLAPRAMKAAGFLRVAYGQQMPLIPALVLMFRTVLDTPQIIADVKADALSAAADQAKAQAEQTKAELVKETLAEVAAQMKSGSFLTSEMSDAIPPELRAALAAFAAKPLTSPPSETDEHPAAPTLSTPILTASVTVGDKVPA